MMERKLWGLDLNILKNMYDREAASLKTALLNGASWDEVKDQRRKVTELSIAIHKLRYRSGNPAESSSRKEP